MTIADNTMGIAHLAMAGLQSRSELRANNIANAETPEYQAKTSNFEASLRQAIARGAPTSADVGGMTTRNTMSDVHGNTVDLEVEMVEMLEDGVRFSTMVSTFNYKVGVIRTAIGGR